LKTFVNKGVNGFKALSPLIINFKGLLFYECPKGVNFNLPSGAYSYIGKFEHSPLIDYSKKFILDKPEKKIPFLDIKKIKVTNNPNKCSIYVNSGLVIIDKAFFNSLNDIQKTFILLHEVGHFYYYTEKKCDNYAKVQMLKAGYNPSQISATTKSTLLSNERNNYIFNKLKK